MGFDIKQFSTKTASFFRNLYVPTPFDIDENFSGLESYAMSGNIFTERVRFVF